MSKKMQVLFAGYECAPFFKKGGLGDVMGSLPLAFETLGLDTRVVMPYYDEVMQKYPQKKIGQLDLVFDRQLETVGIYQGSLPKSGVATYFIRNKKYLQTSQGVNKEKQCQEFAFFDVAIVELVFWLVEHVKWEPDIIHCNDWHTALVPLILNKHLIKIPTLLTIHNLSYQGIGSRRILDMIHVDDADLKVLKNGETENELNILGEGILHASAVSTVSKTYAKEIASSKNKGEIYKYFQRRKKEEGKKFVLHGILNGIDYKIWTPEKDAFLHTNYTRQTVSDGKAQNKATLLAKLGLTNKITFCFIGRMVTQKGIDLFIEAIDKLKPTDANFILLGVGSKKTEESLLALSKKYPEVIRAELHYDQAFAHLLYAGSDYILIPSHFEPCGLIQMIAMRYGTIPIASRTGGLVDSITDGKNGFLFQNGSVADFVQVVKKAVETYQDKNKYHDIVQSAMHTDFSWKKSAAKYIDLYKKIINKS